MAGVSFVMGCGVGVSPSGPAMHWSDSTTFLPVGGPPAASLLAIANAAGPGGEGAVHPARVAVATGAVTWQWSDWPGDAELDSVIAHAVEGGCVFIGIPQGGGAPALHVGVAGCFAPGAAAPAASGAGGGAAIDWSRKRFASIPLANSEGAPVAAAALAWASRPASGAADLVALPDVVIISAGARVLRVSLAALLSGAGGADAGPAAAMFPAEGLQVRAGVDSGFTATAVAVGDPADGLLLVGHGGTVTLLRLPTSAVQGAVLTSAAVEGAEHIGPMTLLSPTVVGLRDPARTITLMTDGGAGTHHLIVAAAFADECVQLLPLPDSRLAVLTRGGSVRVWAMSEFVPTFLGETLLPDPSTEELPVTGVALLRLQEGPTVHVLITETEPAMDTDGGVTIPPCHTRVELVPLRIGVSGEGGDEWPETCAEGGDGDGDAEGLGAEEY
jgi:hypothetical protein